MRSLILIATLAACADDGVADIHEVVACDHPTIPPDTCERVCNGTHDLVGGSPCVGHSDLGRDATRPDGNVTCTSWFEADGDDLDRPRGCCAGSVEDGALIVRFYSCE